MTRQVLPQVVSRINTEEVLELHAYPDPLSPNGEPWTNGYGHAGSDVYPGQVITEAQADHWLIVDIAKAADAVEALLPGRLDDYQFGAVLDLAFNAGVDALRTSTLRRRILMGESPAVVIPQELPRWVHGANGKVSSDLVARRAWFVKFAQTPEPSGTPPPKP